MPGSSFASFARATACSGLRAPARTHCGVYLDEYAYGDAVLRGYLGEVVKVAGVVRADLHLGSARQGAEAGDLVAAGDLVGDEHVGYAAFDHHLGLRDLSGADTANGAAPPQSACAPAVGS